MDTWTLCSLLFCGNTITPDIYNGIRIVLVLMHLKDTVFTLRIGKPYLLTVLVLKFEGVNSATSDYV